MGLTIRAKMIENNFALSKLLGLLGAVT